MNAGANAPRWPEVNDADVVAACSGGDDAAFERIYLALDDRLRGYIFHCSGTIPGADLDAIAGEVWLRTWEKRGRFAGVTGASFVTWVRAIARNLVTDTGRRAGSQARRIEAVKRTLSATEPDRAGEIDQRDAVDRAMLRLPADVRELLYLYYHEDVARPDLAELLHLPLSVLDRQLRNAREMFRRALGTEAGDDDG